MADPAVSSYLAKLLCSRGGRLPLSALPGEAGLSAGQLQQVLRDAGPERFLVRPGVSGDPAVLAASPVRLCVRQACPGCPRLHLCKLNLRGRCRVGACKYSHDILSETNRKVLKNHELSGLNEDELCVLLLQNDSFLLPDVCGAYNKGDGCCTQRENCSRLHVCRYFLKGECRFPRCKRSHNLLDPHALGLLTSEGLDQDTVWNFQTICNARNAAFTKELGCCGPSNGAPAADKERLNTRPKNERPPPINPNNQGVQRASSPKSLNAEKGKSNEICLYYVWQFCKNKNNCSMIHYDLPYRWQISTSNGWKDLSRREEIEKAYCDPNITSFPDLHLDFTTMTCADSPIRRLSTVSSVTKEAKFVMTTKWLWYWQNDLGQWIEYGKQHGQSRSASPSSDDLENLFLAEPDGTIQFEVGSQKYQLSFKNMTQENLIFPTKREVRRRPKFVSSEDVRTKKGWSQKGDHVSPPGPSNCHKYEAVAQRANFDHVTTGMLQRSHTATTTTPAPTPSPVAAPLYPPEWDLAALPAIGFRPIELNRGSPEFMKIENLFHVTMKNSKIRKIERIQNPSLWQVYQWQKEQMKKKKGGQKVDERLLFHGTRPSVLKAICTDNFDWRICGTNGTVYGKGSYFARDANYSDSYCQAKDDEKVMFVARVLVGDFTVGHPMYTRPPAKLTGLLDTFDSCVDRVANPSVFIIFEKHQAYPAYLIFYSEEKKCILS